MSRAQLVDLRCDTMLISMSQSICSSAVAHPIWRCASCFSQLAGTGGSHRFRGAHFFGFAEKALRILL
jgi:hypothetical protein